MKTYIYLMDGVVGNADFLNEAVQVGKAWGMEQPERSANDDAEEAFG